MCSHFLFPSFQVWWQKACLNEATVSCIVKDETCRAHMEHSWWCVQHRKGRFVLKKPPPVNRAEYWTFKRKMVFWPDWIFLFLCLVWFVFFFFPGSFQQEAIFSKTLFSWQTMMCCVYFHVASFTLLFLFTSANAWLLMLWGLYKVVELSEVLAEPFCCWSVCLFSK